MTTLRKIALPLLIAGTFAAFGCATTEPKKEKAAELDANGKPIEYVWVTPTGSHIAVKVPKSQAQSSEESSAKDQETLRRIRDRNGVNPSGN